MDGSLGNEQVITDWLRHNAIPIRHLEPGNGFTDLRPLKQLLHDAKVVGLGEATHGTREFFQFKHRLIEFLVTEMDFTILTIEAGYAACQPINDNIRDGKGERAAVLTGQHYLAWDTEEVSAMLEWLRAHNQRVSDARKVTFSGVDMTFNENGRRAVLDYLKMVAPDRVDGTDSLFRILAAEESKWPWQIDEESNATVREALPVLRDLMEYLTEHQDEIASRTSAKEHDRILQFVRVMWQRSTSGDSARSQHMAENLLYLMDRERADAKCVYWGHNFHVGVESFPDKEPTLGHVLRQRYGDAYFAIAMEFSQGTYQARVVESGPFPGELKVATSPPVPAGSLPWYLARADVGNFMVSLRSPVAHPVVGQWLDTPQLHHALGWVCEDPVPYEPAAIRQRYDAVAFIEDSTPARPTKTALETAARGEDL